MSNPSRPIGRRTFLRGVGLTAAALGCGPIPVFGLELGHEHLPRSSPEAQGVSSRGVLAFLDAIANSNHEFHSFMVVRHGNVVAEGWWKPYSANLNHMLYSLSKSFTSTAVGFAVTEGKLTVNDAVTSFFPNDLPADVSDNLRALRVKHLLTMSVGHAEDSTPHIRTGENWARAFLALPIVHEPGTHFLYNSGATYMLSAIVQHVTGRRVIDYLRPRLFDPLAISGMTWETCPRGINTGGWGLSVPSEALAKFGQFYLQQGRWRGRQLLPATWINEATTFKIQQPATGNHTLDELKQTSDWHQGYCYQFWRCRHNAFRGDGAFGQFMIVMPQQDAVVAITCETGNMQSELNLVWDYLLDAMQDGPLPADHSTHARLRERLASLTLLPPRGREMPEIGKTVSGKTYRLEPNKLGLQSVAFDFNRRQTRFTASDSKSNYPIECGAGKWIEGVTNLPGTPPRLTPGQLPPSKIAASGAWQDETTFLMTWRFYETPHHDSVTCRFDGRSVEIEILNSLEARSAHPKPGTVLAGQLV